MVSERLRLAICDEPIPCKTPEGQLSISTSIGGAIIKPEENAAPEEALKRADICLYQAKKDLGRNCSVFEDIGKLNPDDYQSRGRPELDE